MLKRTLMLSVVMLAVVSMGCSTTQKWMAAGAGGGALIGGIWGAEAGILNAGEGALVGAMTGATAGALVGDMQESGDEFADLNAVIQEKDATIAELQDKNRSLMNDVAGLKEDLAYANRKIENLEDQIASLSDELAKCRGARMEISLLADVLFVPGSDILSAQGKKALDDAAKKIMDAHEGKFITVEGHTDSDPIKYSKWDNNWELGSARSLVVLDYLVKKGLDPAKCSAATYGPFQPVAENDSKANKAKNRRAVIVIHTGWPRF